MVSGGGPTPQGTVQFVVDGSNFGSPVTLSGGAATSASTTLLGAGNHTVVAQYSGDPNYAANTGSYTQVVNQANLTVVADDKQMNHYDAVPALTYHYTGFVNGDNCDQLRHHSLGESEHRGELDQPRGLLPDPRRQSIPSAHPTTRSGARRMAR